METTTALTVDIWSDIACPWCYVGKRRFEAGAATFAANGGAVAVEFHSFELAPDTPVGSSVGELDYLATRLGVSREQGTGMLAQMTELAAAVGLTFDFDALRHTNTARAHQLTHYAKARGRQLDVQERLFGAYFGEGRDLGRIDVLAELAEAVGLDGADVARSLAADEFLADVRGDEALARDYGITGVPFFVVEGRYGISGAREPATFADALERIQAERATG